MDVYPGYYLQYVNLAQVLTRKNRAYAQIFQPVSLRHRHIIRANLYPSSHIWITDHYRHKNEDRELDDEMPATGQEEVKTAVDKRIRQQELRAALIQLSSEQVISFNTQDFCL